MKMKFTDQFWAPRIRLMVDEVIPYQWKALNDEIPGAEPSHAIENFRIAAGEITGEFHGMIFQDSDVAKWIEAASYSLSHEPDAELENIIDDVVDLMNSAQQDDGYLNTYFSVVAPEQRWQDQSFGHELYCAGHLIEAAVAYYEATGKRKFLDMMCKYVDLIEQVIGPEPHQMQIYDGHEEIELALVKLYQVTQDERHLKLSQYFVEERGKQPSFLEKEPTFGGASKDRWFALDYHQAHAPVREQLTAEGHAVRAMYLFAAMADLAYVTKDDSLLETLIHLWKNVTTKRMYITGGIGSQGHAERFTIDYDLPNDTAYAETCAAIGLVMWASRMLRIDPKGEYADMMERALYNGALSGISYDGTRYFYVNPLEVHPHVAKYRYDMKHVETERVPWFGCACCPPNIARLILSLDKYVYTVLEQSLYVNLYVAHQSAIRINDQEIRLNMQTNYPWDAEMNIQLELDKPTQFTMCLRWPAWAKEAHLSINDEVIDVQHMVDKGYINIDRVWKPGDHIILNFPMEVLKLSAHPKVHENAGKIALQRGPMVYCIEEVDNGPDLTDISIFQQAAFTTEYREDMLGGIVVLHTEGQRSSMQQWEGKLYDEVESRPQAMKLTAVPYAYWGNRNPGEMLVWIRRII